MERLTKRDFVFSSHYVANRLQSWSIAECLKNLQEYENAEEDGRITVLPCNVGDTVYQHDAVRIYPSTIKKLIFDTGNIAFDETAIGQSIFLTEEAAEAALERMVNNEP